ncbi:DUF808 domain-containing protein [Corynebacterium sp. LK2590]|uniref:DUF808 domain-containing protein n=1 Tax=unclassified Corynebacterium TaxID=2624378 RepID=UPI0034CE9647
MTGGLLALFDDIALIARSAASSIDDVAALTGKTSAKAVGVVVDDAAVTPQYVAGVDPKRELPMIWRITKGSLVNKLIIILPVALLLSWLAPWALTPILMLGGCYLCFEGAHKIAAKLLPGMQDQETPVRESGPEAEDSLVSSAIRTDLILSAEIMVIALNELMEESFGLRVVTLITIAIVFTLGVYGAVAVLVKMDDIGLRLLERREGNSFVGKALVKGMPYVLHIIGIIGTAAMLWVGGHILTSGLAEFGLSAPADAVHHLSQLVPAGVLEWLVDTAGSMVFGFMGGAIIVAVVEGIQHVRAAK